MPWEKNFDEDAVLDKAMAVFWEKGYESTSISDLLKATGINKGSLYNAYGGKQKLFMAALLKYEKERHKDTLAQLEAMDDPKAAIHTLLETLVAEASSDVDKKGCFLINTAHEIATHEQDVLEIVTRGLREMEAFLRRSVEVGQARGEFPADLDAAATAKSLVGVIVAIRVLGRGAFPASALNVIAEGGKQLVA